MTGLGSVPNGERAVVPREKLERYVLSPDHPTGRHKARVFASALGIHAVDWQYLADQLAKAAAGSLVVAIRESAWGLSYEVESLVDGLNGRSHPVISIWFVARDPGADSVPRLITCYVAIP